jgi:hypothetical protein
LIDVTALAPAMDSASETKQDANGVSAGRFEVGSSGMDFEPQNATVDQKNCHRYAASYTLRSKCAMMYVA